MKKYIIFMLATVFAAGCSSVTTKQFKVFTDPADASIRVVSGAELKVLKYASPATVTAEVPKDPALAAKAVVEVSKGNYTPKTIALSDITHGSTLNVKLEKILRDLVKYRLTCRLISPVVSQELQFRDKSIAVSFVVGEQSVQMRFENLGPRDLKILWERSEYTDANNQQHRLMHSGVHYQDRNNPIPDQFVLSHSVVQETVIPISKVYFSQQKKAYEIHPLFTLDSDAAAALKGKTINLFIPVEIDRQIIPYNFKIEITDSVKEIIKG